MWSILLNIALAADPTWRVLETDSHRILYTEEAAEWTEDLALRLTAIRRAVEEEIGHSITGQTQVLVRDPYSVTNGAAYALGRRPRMDLWASAPTADEELGFYGTWSDVLFAHEDAHIVHLLMHPRNPTGEVLFNVFGIGPLLRKSPPWVAEGYATLVEGRVTGSGRPRGAYRATLLRRMAQRGHLPSYGQLNGRWRYTVGSAFLEWLDEREGGDSLRRVWARMSAKLRRTYPVAFKGVYGDTLPNLYARFTAELTADAMDADGAQWRPDTQWMRLRGPSRGISISPNEERLAIVRRGEDGLSELVIVSMSVNEEAIERRAERAEHLLAADPEDVPDKPLRLPPHKVLSTYRSRTHPPAHPRWIDDEHLLYDAPVLDGEGRARRDLFIHDTTTGRSRRLTHLADLRRATPDGEGSAWAVMSSYGRTALAKVNLQTGDTTLLSEPSVKVVIDQPRPSPNGEDLAWLENHGDGFSVMLQRGDDKPISLPMPKGASAVSIGWEGEQVVASLALDGRFDIWRLGEHAPVRLSSTGGAVEPEPWSGGLLHLELEFDRHDIHLLPPDSPVFPASGSAPGLAGPTRDRGVPLPTESLSPRPMKLGPLQARALGSGMVGAGGSTMELGLRVGDIAGRNEFLFAISAGDDAGQTGIGAWWTNRTGPVHPTLRAWGLQGAVQSPLWFGGSLSASSETGSSTTSANIEAGLWSEASISGLRAAAFGELSAGWLEPSTRSLWLWATASGSAGVEETALAQGNLAAGFSLGRRWELVVDGGIRGRTDGNLVLGGVTSGLKPVAAQWGAHRAGWALIDSGTGPVLTAMSAGFGIDGVMLGVERVQIDGRSFSYAGLLLHSVRSREPLFGVPGLSMEAGLGCAVEKGAPLEADVCRKLSDLRTWTQLLWRP